MKKAHLALEKSLAVIEEKEEELGRLDALAGDGDHGAGMVRGFGAAVEAEGGSASGVLVQAGMAFADAAGGASGALFGTLISTVGQSLPQADEEIDAAAVHRALDAGLQRIRKLGKANPGDKTMIDTLAPFIEAFGEAAGAGASLAEAWRGALSAAEEGWQSTQDMISKKGRSARLGERSRGHLDPGATSAFYVLRAVAEALEAA